MKYGYINMTATMLQKKKKRNATYNFGLMLAAGFTHEPIDSVFLLWTDDAQLIGLFDFAGICHFTLLY